MAEESTTIMNYVSILALRPLEASSHAQSGINMHRVLKNGQLYKLHSGFNICSNTITLDLIKPQNLYSINQQDRETPIIINFSAIVGENGSGKSTIIDYIIRIINNLSAVLFGEYYRKSAEHLHYINEVFAELFVLVEKAIFGITCNGMKFSIDMYELTECSEAIAVFKRKDTQKTYETNLYDPCENKDECYELLSRFCYTMVVNYSLYSFDIGTYIGELTTIEKESNINTIGIAKKYTTKRLKDIIKESETSRDITELIEARSWLPGIFWNFDDYQIPLLITPNRHKGQVDQRKEYINGKEKLLSLAILRDENNQRVFTRINNKETIDKITLKLDPAYAIKTYFSIFEESFPNLSQTMRLCLYNLVRNLLSIKYDIKKTNSKNVETAWYYIVNKFFDIIRSHPELKEHRVYFQTLTNRLDTETITKTQKAIKDVCNIHSHATRLFMRSLYYLKFNLLSKIAQTSQSGELEISIDQFTEEAYSLKNRFKRTIHNIDELLPPPIFNLDFKLYSHDDTNKENVITFETLSSGEKQITLSLSTIYHYLTNLDSISSKKAKTTKSESKEINDDEIICYRHVCVIFDELELYFHPEMQRTFISRLLAGLKQLSFEHIESIQFIMVTHSPFILSDIPHKSVLFLDKNGNSVSGMHTFGANIHSMLEYSFFLKNGSIGAFAKSIIGKIEACLNIYKIIGTKKNDIKELIRIKDQEGYEFLAPFFEKNKKRQFFNVKEFCSFYSKESIKATIELFDEPIIKNVLLNDFYEAFPSKKNEEYVKHRRKLEIQISSLKNAAEESPDDKDIKELISDLESQLKTLENEQ